MANHDNSYKLLFSDPSMVRDLLTGFIDPHLIAKLDLYTLERVNGSYVSDDLRDREDDIIWRLRCADNWLYVYLLLEFQSTVDPWMAVRIMAYEALLYQDLIRQKALSNGRLPAILPIVLYNGERRWTAAQDIAELIDPLPVGLEPYRPSLRYLLLDEGALLDEARPLTRNLVATLFQLEHHQQPEQWVALLRNLATWLKAPEHHSLRRAFTVWVRRVLLNNRPPDLNSHQVSAIQDLDEVNTMMSERIKRWPDQWLQEGREEIRQQTARNLIEQTTLDDDAIARVTGLDQDAIKALRQPSD